MKKLITTTAFIFAFLSYSSAQGNLQFNQVVNGSFDLYVPYAATILGTITVPAGKVWKIESTLYTYEAASGIDWVFNQLVYIGSNVGFVLSNTIDHGLPLWLSEGTYQVKATGGNDSNCEFSYAAIEFNIIP